MPSSAALLAALLAAAPAAASGPWTPADPAWSWAFPRDHHGHPGHRNEWWYLTGTLEALDAPGRRFGVQLTFFRVGLLPQPPALDSAWATGEAVMGHLAITDVAGQVHTFAEVLWRAAPLLGGFPAPDRALLAWAQAPPGTDGRWTLQLAEGADGAERFRLEARDQARGAGLALEARPVKPRVLQGPNGYSRKAARPGYASLYYSYPRLATEGTLTVGGRTYRVRGTSWLDREFGSSQLAPEQVGWDWWSLRLADGRDLMLYVLRRRDGGVDFATATLADRDGAVRLLGPEAWSVRVRGRWRSPRTGADYPSGWEIEVPGAGIRVTVEPEVAGAENVSALAPGLSYWEGPVRLTGSDGRPAGEGYVELTGYGAGTRPPI
ncbi:MAG: lipocalin-like domain-containing protein [Anaeromyxobacter sp.]